MQLLAIAGTILGLVGLAGGVVGYFAKSRGDSIIEYQAREISLRDGTIARLEKDNAALVAKSNSQAEQIITLTGLAQGSPQLLKLTDEIKNLVREFRNAGKDSRNRGGGA
jgi:hypothetical protein